MNAYDRRRGSREWMVRSLPILHTHLPFLGKFLVVLGYVGVFTFLTAAAFIPQWLHDVMWEILK